MVDCLALFLPLSCFSLSLSFISLYLHRSGVSYNPANWPWIIDFQQYLYHTPIMLLLYDRGQLPAYLVGSIIFPFSLSCLFSLYLNSCSVFLFISCFLILSLILLNSSSLFLSNIWLSVSFLFQLQQSLFNLRSPSLGPSAPPPSSPARRRVSLSRSSPGWRTGRSWSLGDTSNSGTTTGEKKLLFLVFLCKFDHIYRNTHRFVRVQKK